MKSNKKIFIEDIPRMQGYFQRNLYNGKNSFNGSLKQIIIDFAAYSPYNINPNAIKNINYNIEDNFVRAEIILKNK